MSSDHSFVTSAGSALKSLKFRPGRHGANSGTMNCGARIRRGRLAAGVLLASVAALMTIACGGSSSSSTAAPTNGALYTLIGDTPSCDVLSFGVFYTEMDLHKAGAASTTLLTVWPTGSAPISPVIEMSTLRDSMTIANLTTVPPGTYDQIVLKAVVNGASTFDSTQSPPVSNFAPAVSTESVTINLQPELTVTSGKVSTVQLDLNLPQSLAVDSLGALTGTVNWVFTGRPLVASATTGFGEMDNLYGFVRSVTPVTNVAGFTSAFLLQTLSQTATSSSGGGPALTVNLTSQTQLVGVPQISQLPTGSYVEVDAYINQDGNLVANGVQVEDRESVSQQLLGYMGPVLDVTKDSNGNVTQFDMLARETQPNDAVDIPVDSTITVNVSSSTTFSPYQLSSDLTNLASGNLSFDDTTLAPGQEVVVHGVFTKPTSGPISVAANSVYSRLQSVQGTFSSLVGSPGSDDKTGAFHLSPCGGILGSHPVMVVTDAQTNFVNTSGLSTLSPTTALLVRGLTFLDVAGSTVNGTPVPAGTMVLLAKEVRQF